MMRFLLVLLALSSFAAHAMTDAERDLLREAARAESQSKMPPGTGALLARLGNAKDIAALDELIALHNLRMLRELVESWGASRSPPEYESRVLRHFDDREVAAILIGRLYDYHDPALFETLYREVAATAKLRAERRKGCRAQIAQYQPMQVVRSGAIGAQSPAIQGRSIAAAPGSGIAHGGFALGGASQRFQTTGNALIGWSFVCDRGAPDSMALDLDGHARSLDGRPSREEVSVEAIARNEIPGTEARLAPLFRDLSLYPLPDWRAVSLPGEPPAFRTAYPPMAFVDLYKKRLYAPAPAPLLEVLKELVPIDREYGAAGAPYNQAVVTDNDTWWKIVAIHTALVPSDAPEATRALGVTLERAAAIAKPEDRRQFLTWLVPLLGPVLPQAQIDLAALKARILDRAPYEGVPELSGLLARVDAENRSLREPSAASLTRWVDSPHWRRLFDYLLAHGADPNQPVPPAVQPPLLAAIYRNEAAAMLLLDKGADIRVRDGAYKVTTLHAACDFTNVRVDRSAIAARLIKMGADVNAESAGRTPLHFAAAGSAACVRLLLGAGARLEALDNLGRTPLAWAASNGNLESARLLLDAGADPNHEDKEGGSAFTEGYNRPEMRALLETRGGRLSVAQMAQRAKMEMLLRGGFSPH